ncbi:DUF2769 domain-containing protein [Methanogenium organophilum]|uniref:DUF2769 domain-containing protein n=1 Tax=Methanogenium organophilum TaxID=2199 RepID=A0A9X9S2W3_METOG|nr:DUF2769 domain-containing protein [Methanogenium organophilum]WAI00523.1 DUF2769 domain-containing protein [Methanogenium organophilum]
MPSDYFEMMLRSLNLTTEEREMVVEKRKEQCICDICPTFRECGGEKEGNEGFAFCTLGTSNCILKEVECLCSTCPLSREMGLAYSYYCTRGSETQQKIRDVIGVK